MFSFINMFTVWHYLSLSLNFMQKNPKLYNVVSYGIAAKHFLVLMVSSVDVTMSDKKKNLLPSFEILKMSRHIVRMHLMTTFVIFLMARLCSGELWQNENILKYFNFQYFTLHRYSSIVFQASKISKSVKKKNS